MGSKAKQLPTFETQDAMGREVTATPGEDIEIGADLNQEMTDQPGLFAWYGLLAVAAQARAKQAKYEVHCMQEDLDTTIRANWDEGEGKITERAIETKINSSPKMRKCYQAYMSASREAGLLKILQEAFVQRKEMLQAVGANRRQELEQGEVQTLRKKAAVVTAKLKRQRDEDDDD